MDKTGRLYCGTGEANLSGDSYPGAGLFALEPGGDNKWTRLGENANLPLRIGVVAVNPYQQQNIRLGGVTHTDDEVSGMYFSTDGGKNWQRDNFISERNYWCHSIVYGKENVILAAIQARGSQNGIWRSVDGGKKWEQCREGLPPGDAFARTSLAVCENHRNIVYALAANHQGGVLGVFRSADDGKSWRSIGWDYLDDEDQMSYNNCIAVHPTKPDCVICGGIDLHRTEDGGRNWIRVTEWDAPKSSSYYAHGDHHALLILDVEAGNASKNKYGNKLDLVLDANDGGFFFSKDGGATWQGRNNGLVTTMFYDVDVAPSNASFFGGGTQDNGTVVTEQGEKGGKARFKTVLEGDGGWMVYDPADEKQSFISYQRIHLFRRRVTRKTDITPAGISSEERRLTWMSFMAIGPRNHPSAPTSLYAGSTRVWRTLTDGNDWEAVSPILDGSPVSAIEIATADPRCIYVGTTNGGVFRSLDGGNTWSQNLAGPELPGRIITRIEAHPANPKTAILTVGTLPRRPHQPDSAKKKVAQFKAPNPHVFLTLDGGQTWQDADPKRHLPDVPHHAVTFEAAPPYRAFVASDSGVYVGEDLSWKDMSGNLPNVMVVDLVYHDEERTLTAATYGRGLWRYRVSER